MPDARCATIIHSAGVTPAEFRGRAPSISEQKSVPALQDESFEQTDSRVTSESRQASRMCSGPWPEVPVTPNQVPSHFPCVKSASTPNMLALCGALNKQKHESPRKSLQASRMCSGPCPKVLVTPNQVPSHFPCVKSASTPNMLALCVSLNKQKHESPRKSLQASRMCSGRWVVVPVTPNQVPSHFRCVKSAPTANMLALCVALNKQKHESPRNLSRLPGCVLIHARRFLSRHIRS